jgi:phage baseplate assembly protein gpV
VTPTLYDTIRRIVQEELGQVRTAELAVVEEQHPDEFAASVKMRDSGIVLRKVPVATQRIGAVSLPAVGDLVLVQFVGGSVNAPIVTGRLYNDEDRPPANDDAQAILHLPLDAGDDDAVHWELHSGDKREIVLKLGSGLDLALRDDDPVIELSVDGGKATLKIERDGAVTLESQGDLKVKGGADVKLEGKSITVEATGELNLKGSKVNLN